MATAKKPKSRKSNFSPELLAAIGITQTDDGSGAGYQDVSVLKLTEEELQPYIPDEDYFSYMRKAKDGEWLAEHKESGQTLKQYLTGMRMIPDRRHNTIFLQPLTFMEDPIPAQLLNPLQKFAEVFFGLPVKIMKVTNLKDKVPSRTNKYTHTYQAHAPTILKEIKKTVPGKAFCVAGITMCDLYPRDSWNFVFGLANLGDRTGVYSLARYLSDFGEEKYTKCDFKVDSMETLIIRSCKTMCHEIGHMFGLKHCLFYDCIMNGSNHLDESDRRPIFLCPVCLRKLQYACGFNTLERYQNLLEFSTEHHLEKQIQWLQGRIRTLSE